MAEVIIKIIDNDNGHISVTLESAPIIQQNDLAEMTEAQELGMAFVEYIVRHGVKDLIKSAKT